MGAIGARSEPKSKPGLVPAPRIVLDEVAIRTEGLGGLAGVAAGSDEPPRLIELVYAPANARGTVALVGKGITFDTGGISLKPQDGLLGPMWEMKYDMSGGAAVLGVFHALRSLELPLEVHKRWTAGGAPIVVAGLPPTGAAGVGSLNPSLAPSRLTMVMVAVRAGPASANRRADATSMRRRAPRMISCVRSLV